MSRRPAQQLDSATSVPIQSKAAGACAALLLLFCSLPTAVILAQLWLGRSCQVGPFEPGGQCRGVL